MVRCSSHCWSRHMSDWSCHTRSVQTMIHLKPSNPIDEPTTPDSNNREQSCHDTPPRLISFSLGRANLMTPAEIVDRFFTEVWNRRQFSVLDEIVDPACVTHQVRSAPGAITAASRGPDAL